MSDLQYIMAFLSAIVDQDELEEYSLTVKRNLLTRDMSERFRRLACEVLLWLPAGWDHYRTFDIQESEAIPHPPSGGIGYATAFREEEAESFAFELPAGVNQNRFGASRSTLKLWRVSLTPPCDGSLHTNWAMSLQDFGAGVW